MPITRHFLGYDGPIVHRAVDYLHTSHGQGEHGWDLGHVIAVLPTKRAGRRLMELLASRAQAQQAVLIPPRIETTGRLPELLYESAAVQASDLDQQLAFVYALQSLPTEAIEALLPHPPVTDDVPGWWAYASKLRRLRDDLAGHRMRFADVPRLCQERGIDLRGEARWRVLDAIEQVYAQTLDKVQRSDPNLDRLNAIQSGQCFLEQGTHIVLVACPDLNDTAAAMLRLVNERITTLVMAPEQHADGFDELGILRSEYWCRQPVKIDDDQLRIVGRKTEQADAVVRVIAEAQQTMQRTGHPFTADQVTVGLGDERFADPVRRRLGLSDIPCRRAAGTPALLSRPAVLLRALGRFMESRRLDALAELLRHPDIEAYLDRADEGDTRATIENWLTLLDKYATEHLQGRLTDHWLGHPKQQLKLKTLYDRVIALLPVDPGKRMPLPRFSEPIAAALTKVYQDAPLRDYQPDEQQLAQALEQIAACLREQAELHETSLTCPKVSISEAIALTLRRLSEQVLPDEHDGPAVELLGYLELALDDAPVLAITGMNEGLIPSSRTADAFLPDSVRKRLSMRDNDHRYARDLMLLGAMIHSRPAVRLIAARRTDDGEPLKPSRLLLTCDDRTLLRRVKQFFNDDQAEAAPTPPLAHGRTNRFLIPPPVVAPQPLNQLPVTAFRAYLACPYRFYLRYVLKLAPLDDTAIEMDPLSFGSITHEILQAFGQSDLRDETDPVSIKDFLTHRLDQTIRDRFGEDRRPAIRIQAEQLRQRLDIFADRQAGLAQDGWRIKHVELKRKTPVMVDHQPFTLIGKIDRIDYHKVHGYRIYDYKTGDSANSPEKNHHTGRGDNRAWNDLQLPLYRDLCADMNLSGDIALGYFNLPKKLQDVGPKLAQWTDEDLVQASAVRDDVIRKVRRQAFWPPSDYKGFPDGFERLCGDNVMQRGQLIEASAKTGILPGDIPGVGGDG